MSLYEKKARRTRRAFLLHDPHLLVGIAIIVHFLLLSLAGYHIPKHGVVDHSVIGAATCFAATAASLRLILASVRL